MAFLTLNALELFKMIIKGSVIVHSVSWPTQSISTTNCAASLISRSGSPTDFSLSSERTTNSGSDNNGRVLSPNIIMACLWMLLSIVGFIFIVYFALYWLGRKRTGTLRQTTGLNILSEDLADSQSLPSQARRVSIWSKVFSMRQDVIFAFIGWPTIQRFASRSKIRIRDLEMQQVPIENVLQSSENDRGLPGGPTLEVGLRAVGRAGARVDYERAGSETLENLRQHQERLNPNLSPEFRHARLMEEVPDVLNSQQRQTLDRELSRAIHREELARLDITQAGILPQRPVLLVIPQPIAQLNARQTTSVSHPIFDVSSISEPSIVQTPPPTYAEHPSDEIVHLADSRDPSYAAEEDQDSRRPPPYTASWTPVRNLIIG